MRLSKETYRHLQEVHGTQGKGGNLRRPDSYQKDETTFPYDNQIAVYGRRMQTQYESINQSE
ncbi:hypothetical protein [Porphyromonas gingivalis]|uniref:hypothetical protein n=2 Tax=Porphyromonas gingivalis TaxID=837 RepID=UPI0002FFE605|nr:hypothetical protein [Porphyromonas gingivalis]ERJ83409.1 hypothetical protein HMPREF1988_01172 [Porphyromonas gingivalis F0185]